MRIGIDIVEKEQFSSLVDNKRFINRIYSPKEIVEIMEQDEGRKVELMAGRFATKEAVLKALGIGIKNFKVLKEIEVTKNLKTGEAELNIYGSLSKLLHERRLINGQVSISHSKNIIVAFVLLN